MRNRPRLHVAKPPDPALDLSLCISVGPTKIAEASCAVVELMERRQLIDDGFTHHLPSIDICCDVGRQRATNDASPLPLHDVKGCANDVGIVAIKDGTRDRITPAQMRQHAMLTPHIVTATHMLAERRS